MKHGVGRIADDAGCSNIDKAPVSRIEELPDDLLENFGKRLDTPSLLALSFTNKTMLSRVPTVMEKTLISHIQERDLLAKEFEQCLEPAEAYKKLKAKNHLLGAVEQRKFVKSFHNEWDVRDRLKRYPESHRDPFPEMLDTMHESAVQAEVDHAIAAGRKAKQMRAAMLPLMRYLEKFTAAQQVSILSAFFGKSVLGRYHVGPGDAAAAAEHLKGLCPEARTIVLNRTVGLKPKSVGHPSAERGAAVAKFAPQLRLFSGTEQARLLKSLDTPAVADSVLGRVAIRAFFEHAEGLTPENLEFLKAIAAKYPGYRS